MKNIHNFNAGTSVLPKEIIQKSVRSLINFKKSGLSILEISHRSLDFLEIINKASSLIRSLTKLKNDYSILFLQGGATLQFSMIPLNFLIKKDSYLDTGYWSNKALQEASKFGNVNIIFSGKNKNYTYIPNMYKISKNINYFHCTSNNTIVGTQIKKFPNTSVPIVCDMSSDIFSRKLNFRKFSLIYASAQKNIGISGITVVIIKNKFLEKVNKKIPIYMDYKSHIKNNKILNTPNVFSIYVSMLTLQWIKKNGGLKKLEKINKLKSRLLYE